MSVRGRVHDVLRQDVGVVKADLFGQRIIRRHHVQQRCSGETAHRKLARAVKEFALGDPAMGVIVIQLKQFLIEILGRHSLSRGNLVHVFAPCQAALSAAM